MRLILEYILYFFIYSFFGWCCEVIYCSNFEKKEFVNRGILTGPICPIYGTGACLLIALLYKHSDNIIFMFILGILITSTIEYITSVILERLFNARWWDYSGYPLNINGRVCLLNSGLFGVLVVLLIRYVHKEVEDFILVFNTPILVVLCIILLGVFMYDLIKSVSKLREFNCKLDEIRDLNLELKKYNINLRDRLSGKSDFEFDKRKLKLKKELNKLKNSFVTEKRILKAFPRIKHRKYDEEIKSIRKFFDKKL